MLVAEPSDLARRFGLRLIEGLDDLDRFQAAVADLGGVGRAWLSQHDGDPNPGTGVRVDAAVDPAVPRRALVDVLSLDGSDARWWSPEAA